MKIKAKILQFGQKYGMSGSEIAQKIGCARSSFTGEAMNNGLNSDSVQRFLKMYPEVSAEWLMRDEGPMIRTNTTPGEQNINNGVNNGHIGLEHLLDRLTESLSKPQTPVDVSIPVSCDWKGCLILQMKQEVIDAMRITIKTLQENPEK